MKKLRQVTVKYSNDDVINTSMAKHLKDIDIHNYFKIGKEFNIGDGYGNDLIAQVVDVKIEL